MGFLYITFEIFIYNIGNLYITFIFIYNIFRFQEENNGCPELISGLSAWFCGPRRAKIDREYGSSLFKSSQISAAPSAPVQLLHFYAERALRFQEVCPDPERDATYCHCVLFSVVRFQSARYGNRQDNAKWSIIPFTLAAIVLSRARRLVCRK